MPEYTDDYLNGLHAHYPDGDVQMTAFDLKACLTDLHLETDPAKKAILTEVSRDLATLLQHALAESGRGGEDFVNDGVFHARN